jgi:hypothetical protein
MELIMNSSHPNFSELTKIEEELLVAKLRAIRNSISHPSEKGRSLEIHVHNILRDFLPSEYGLSTGFVVWLSPDGVRMSSQLDIIIYDAIRFGPLIRLDACEVFPLEAVYGYIEVKASLKSSKSSNPPRDSIEACVNQNLAIRKMNQRHFWAPNGSSPVETELIEQSWLSLRSYVFAFESVGSIAGNIPALAKRLANQLKIVGTPAHLHGVYIADRGFIYTRPVNDSMDDEDDDFHVRFTEEHSLVAFKSSLVQALSTYPRPKSNWVPAFDKYYKCAVSWNEQAPEI